MTESQYYYNKYKSLGLCSKCGRNEAAPERTMCKKCLAKKAARAKAARDKDRTAARAYNNEYYRQKKAKAIAEGMCSKCFHEPADKGYKTCWRCRANDRKVVRYELSAEQKQKAIDRKKQINAERIAAHVCINCGKRPPMKGKQKCKLCAARHNRNRRQKRHELGLCIPHDMRGDGLHCARCCKPVCNGERICPDCMDKLREQAKRLNEYNREHNFECSETFRKTNAEYFANRVSLKERKNEIDWQAVRFGVKK